MKISKLNSKNQMTFIENNNGKISKTEDFSGALDLANREFTEGNLKEMYKNIESIGKRLISTRSVGDAKEYKKKIQEYLAYIVKSVYLLKREPGPFNYGIHVRIEVINNKLDELTKDFIFQQRESIELADKIEEIRGLLIDIYK